MKSLKKNNKGFTLIELLAVIVILGVLMIIAVPMVTQYISSAKKSAFVDTAKAYVSSARYAYLNGDYDCGDDYSIDSGSGGAIAIKFTNIDVDKTGGNSSFGKEIKKDLSYVIIVSDSSGKYTYYVRMVDAGSNGWDVGINEDELKKQNVSNTATIDTTNEEAKKIHYKPDENSDTTTTVSTVCTKY